jgi:hypothetical protein
MVHLVHSGRIFFIFFQKNFFFVISLGLSYDPCKSLFRFKKTSKMGLIVTFFFRIKSFVSENCLPFEVLEFLLFIFSTNIFYFFPRESNEILVIEDRSKTACKLPQVAQVEIFENDLKTLALNYFPRRSPSKYFRRFITFHN